MSPWQPRFYLAGKISENDWRIDLAPDLLRVAPGQLFDAGNFTYSGPYFIPGEHGCFFSPESHGLVSHYGWSPDSPPRWLVPGLCHYWLRRADDVFAWIDDTSCYGTLIEIGWAHMLKKPVFIGFADWKLKNEMWFAAHGPRTHAEVCNSAKQGFARALATHSDRCRLMNQ